MKALFKILCVLIIILVCSESHPQEIRESKISEFAIPGNADVYDFSIDSRTGNYCYVVWNQDRTGCEVHSRNTVSQMFNFINSNQIRFFSNGHYAAYGDNYQDTLKKAGSTLIVEGKNILTADYMDWSSSFVNKNDEIFIITKEGEKYLLVKYSEANGIEKSDPYDDLRVAYTFDPNAGEEGDGYIDEDRFTVDKHGERFYIGVKDNKAFLIHGDDINSTPYSDIDNSSITYDPNGDLCYIAKRNGGLYSSPKGFFVVRGNKEYKTYDYVYAPLYFDNSGSVYFVAADSVSEYEYNSYIVKNDKKLLPENIKSGNELVTGYQNISISPDGDVSYVAWSDIKQNDELIGQYYTSSSKLVKNNKEYFLGYNVRPFVYGKRGEILYVAQQDRSLMKNDLFLLDNNKTKKINTRSYDEIYGYGFTPEGKIYYLGMINDTSGTSYNNSVDLIVDNVKIGNYSFLIYQSIGDSANALVYSGDGDYAYVAEDKISDSSYCSVVYVNGTKLPFPKVVAEGSTYYTNIYNLFYSKNGRMFFTATTKTGENFYDNVLEVFVDNTSLGKKYSSIGKIIYNKELNEVSFFASRANAIYDVKVKF
jgi:hypothetical protein